MVWQVLIHPAADAELGKIPATERAAIVTAFDKLRAIGPTLGYPHTSDIRAARHLRELRPRQGRSPWRAFYRQIGQIIVIGAVGPEAEADPAGFRRAVAIAVRRLDNLEEDK